jgi:ribosomal protein L7/L12
MKCIEKTAVDIVSGINSFDAAQKLLFSILKVRPSALVKEHEAFTSSDVVHALSDEKKRELRFVEYIKVYNKVSSVKRHRLLYDSGLKDAVEAVDALCDKYHVTYGTLNDRKRSVFDIPSEIVKCIRMLWAGAYSDAAWFISTHLEVSYDVAEEHCARLIKQYDLAY